MTAATRPAARPPSLELPTIPRRTKEEQERAQIQYLMWRIKLFLKDAGASKRRQKEFTDSLSHAWRSGKSYDELRGLIEAHVNWFLAQQARNIQTIYNEK